MVDPYGNINAEGALLLGAAAYEAMQPKEPPDLRAFFIRYPDAIGDVERKLGFTANEVVKAAVGLYRQADPALSRILMSASTPPEPNTQNMMAGMGMLGGVQAQPMMGGMNEVGAGTDTGPNAEPGGLRTAI